MWQYIATLSSKIWWTSISNIAYACILSLITFFAPIQSIILVLLFAVSFDFVTGITKSVREKRKITSFGIRSSFKKLALYLFLIMLIFAVEKTCFPYFSIHKIISAFIILTETLSIVENIETITHKNIGLTTIIQNIRKYLTNLTNKKQ